MSFRKRNIGISNNNTASASASASASTTPTTTPTTPSDTTSKPTPPPPAISLPPGTRPSPISGRPTTSTGTPSLDNLLAGHAGLPLGSNILLTENGTTDYAGSLLKYYAAEGIVQGHIVHVVGLGEAWVRELPGLVVAGAARDAVRGGEEGRGEKEEKMKIAWRYERLGEFGKERAAVDRSQPQSKGSADSTEPAPFCHVFDLAKRLTIPTNAQIHYHPIASSASTSISPFAKLLQSLSAQLRNTPPTSIHRVVIPTLLSPALYPPDASAPQHLLQFFHALRALLRSYPSQLTAMITVPLSLYPRTSGLVRWLEILSDGVLELTPFPHALDDGPSLSTSGAATSLEERPHGMFKVHKLPVVHERGGGGMGLKESLGDDLAFTVSRRRFVIRPFSLPPAEGDTEAQKGTAEGGGGKPTKDQMEF